LPKLRPLVLSETPPLTATFSIPEYDTTAASKLYPPTCDPTTMPTLTAAVAPSYTVLAHRHVADVVEVHMLVLHAASATIADIVRSFEPKLSPLTVTDSPPLFAAFTTEYDTTAASNENTDCSVPIPAPTVTPTSLLAVCMLLDKHTTDVPDVHPPVWHARMPSRTLAVKSTLPRLSPLTVIDPPPLVAPFTYTIDDVTGASYDSRSSPVPATPLTVTLTCALSSAALLPWHATLVALVQPVVWHPIDEVLVELTVRSALPKLSPATLAELPPLTARFSGAPDTTAPSKLNMLVPVPTTPVTVTLCTLSSVPIPTDATQTSVVPDVHDTELHALALTSLLAV
jgi:hypothetical protein